MVWLYFQWPAAVVVTFIQTVAIAYMSKVRRELARSHSFPWRTSAAGVERCFCNDWPSDCWPASDGSLGPCCMLHAGVRAKKCAF